MNMFLLHGKARPWFLVPVVVLVVCLIGASALVERALAEEDESETLGMLQSKLELSDEQTEQMGAVMEKYAAEMEATLAKHENEEEPDPAAMIGDIKKVRNAYREELKKILSKEQYEGYLAIVDAVLTEMMTDVAEIRLMDIQPKCTLTDEQVEQLAPIMGSGMLDIVRLLFENADQKLTMPKKVKLGKALKSIQSDMDKQINTVLTEEQQKAYAAYKEAQKEEQKG